MYSSSAFCRYGSSPSLPSDFQWNFPVSRSANNPNVACNLHAQSWHEGATTPMSSHCVSSLGLIPLWLEPNKALERSES